MNLRVKFNKKNYLKYISHLDTMRLFERAFKRAGIPVEFSQGFNPHPKFSIASPISLGLESEGEYMDIELNEEMSPEEFKSKLNQVLPKDMQILEARYSEDKKTIAALITWAKYSIEIKQENDINPEKIKESLLDWIKKDEIIIERLRKKKKKKVLKRENISDLIDGFKILNIDKNIVEVEVLLKTGSVKNLRPFDFVKALMRDNHLEGGLDLVEMKREKLLIGDKLEIF